jgi:hypothetical protein
MRFGETQSICETEQHELDGLLSQPMTDRCEAEQSLSMNDVIPGEQSEAARGKGIQSKPNRRSIR